ncbi:hypothetical protein EMPS_09467 [Entomortierella parvispora]|uniref:F-box domain-containing protein n=1 Tax=Entomortierella parvispora TaxID=205924 RepID=A0A9P3M0B7_9FUNG|nr:hypothetical protein EMPS_09467 [Entomortierella parvispora]
MSLGPFCLLPPELFGIIAEHLPKSDISACTRVSRGFRRVWSLHVFRELYFTHESQLGYFRLKSVQRLFVRNSMLTRVCSSISGLEHLKILVDAGCSSLRHLDLQFHRKSEGSPNLMFKFLGYLTSDNTCLEYVALHGRYNWTAPSIFPSSCSSLHCLHLDFMGFNFLEEPVQSAAFAEGTRKLLALKQISLIGFQGAVDGLVVLLREAPNLKAIRCWPGSIWMTSDGFKKELTDLMRNVDDLTWEADEIAGQELGEMLDLGSDSKRVTISAPNVYNLTPLVERATRFKSVTLNGLRGPFSARLQSFMEEATGLEELCALPSVPLENNHLKLLTCNIYDSQHRLDMLVIGDHFPTKVWSSATTLTRLEIVIECIFETYVDTTLMALEGLLLVPPMTAESLIEHQIVYGQLGLLVNLQFLRLGQRGASMVVGVDEEHGGYQTSCLVFSLASGLSLLAGMKAMRALDVRWIAHDIAVPELEWMRQNWPLLEDVPGLTDLPPDAGLLSIFRSAAAAEWVLDHPRGIGRSLQE